jgi:hypothetical protein
VTIPNNVTSIEYEAFCVCSSLTNITVNAGNPNYQSEGGVLFNQNLTTLIEYPDGVAGSYVIPNSVTSIGDYAFEVCAGLSSVTIANSVASIGEEAFAGCSDLTNVVIGNSVTSIGEGAFDNCSGLTNAYFLGNAPSVDGNSGSADTTVFYDDTGTVYYVPGTTGWGTNYGGWPTAQWYQPQPQILGTGYGLGVTNKKFNFTVSWATNTSVVIQACTNLSNPVWISLATNALKNGTNYFSDPQWTSYPSRYYRIRSP